MEQIRQVLVFVGVAAVTAYGSQPPASSQSGISDGMQQTGSTAAAQAQSTQGYTITLHTDPAEMKGDQENTFHVSVTDHDGKPVSDATVRLALDMPAMGMAAMKVTPVLSWNGSDYSGKANVPSAGSWSVTIKVVRQNEVIASKNIRLMAK